MAQDRHTACMNGFGVFVFVFVCVIYCIYVGERQTLVDSRSLLPQHTCKRSRNVGSTAVVVHESSLGVAQSRDRVGKGGGRRLGARRVF